MLLVVFRIFLMHFFLMPLMYLSLVLLPSDSSFLLPFPFFKNSDVSGEAQLRVDVPDSITTWVMEAVGLSERGLGLARQTELKTFKPFFIEFTLPYHIIRGEQAKIPLTVHNYLPMCLEVRLLIV